MGTINELKRNRVQGFRDLKTALRTADSSLETAERFIDSVISRKNKIPTAEDLKKITGFLQNIDTNLDTVLRIVSTLTAIFGAF